MTAVRARRVYDAPAPDDGFRVLVDRLWPRGVRKDELVMDAWLRDVAPSTQLREWFGHDPQRFDEFARRYRRELDGSDTFRALAAECAGVDAVTLLYAARDEQCNHAIVLRDALAEAIA